MNDSYCDPGGLKAHLCAEFYSPKRRFINRLQGNGAMRAYREIIEIGNSKETLNDPHKATKLLKINYRNGFVPVIEPIQKRAGAS